MAKQETHSGIPPIFRLVDTMGGRIFRVLDWIAGGLAQNQAEDSTRRCRLLVASTLVIFLFAQFFLCKVYAFCQQESTKYGEHLTQTIDRVLGSQRFSSGT